MPQTIYALSSGSPPAAIAVVRVSGPNAGAALEQLSGPLPEPRRAVARTLRDGEGGVLDRALVLWLPGPDNATGEDCAELHLHGGRAVVRAVESALGALSDLRAAEPGEFTRRAFANGRIDLAEAEGLADLLSAETELQRRAAQALAGGALSRQVEDWRTELLGLAGEVEAVLDFGDEDDVSELPDSFYERVDRFGKSLDEWLDRPFAERLRDGFRVVLAGPPNAGKSSLFNALLEDEAAITAPTEGTTRDVLERSVAVDGVPFTFVDTAGLREGADAVERIGVQRAHDQFDRADIVLWLGPEGTGPVGAWEIAPKSDLQTSKDRPVVSVSSRTGEGVDTLKRKLADAAREALPKPGEVALNRRQREAVAEAAKSLREVGPGEDLLIVAERFRQARVAFDRLTGRASTEHMLDALFGRFCIGK